LAPVSSGRAWRGHDERAADREEEQRWGDSLCENLRAGRHGFPPLWVGDTDRGCGWLLPLGLNDSHGRMPLPFMAGSPRVRREQLNDTPTELFPGRGRLAAQARRVRELEQKLREVTQERDILKKALAYFANDRK